MFARVSRFQRRLGAPATNDGTAQAMIPTMRTANGYRGLISLVDPETGRAIAITLWESEAAMRDSEALADRVRAEGATAGGEEIVGVERFRVDVLEMEA